MSDFQNPYPRTIGNRRQCAIRWRTASAFHERSWHLENRKENLVTGMKYLLWDVCARTIRVFEQCGGSARERSSNLSSSGNPDDVTINMGSRIKWGGRSNRGLIFERNVFSKTRFWPYFIGKNTKMVKFVLNFVFSVTTDSGKWKVEGGRRNSAQLWLQISILANRAKTGRNGPARNLRQTKYYELKHIPKCRSWRVLCLWPTTGRMAIR